MLHHAPHPHGQVCGLIVVVGCTIVRPGKGCIPPEDRVDQQLSPNMCEACILVISCDIALRIDIMKGYKYILVYKCHLWQVPHEAP